MARSDRSRDSDRVRAPQPAFKRRLPHGRGATEQPNAVGDGDAELTPWFWLMVSLTGVGAGVGGIAMMYILFHVQRLVYHYSTGEFQTAVGLVSPTYRFVALLIAGLIGGPAWYLLNRYTKGQKTEVDDVVWSGEGDLSYPKSIITSVIQEVVIGFGASLGREAAPKLLGALSGTYFGKLAHLSPAQRRLLVACGAGAGLAAVYNVPLGGALFTAEIMLGEITLPVVLPAVACSMIATEVAYLYLPNRATYLGIPNFQLNWSEVLWALIAGPIIGILVTGFVRLVGFLGHHRLKGKAVIYGPLLSFGLTGLIGMRYYQLFGNGKDMAHSVFRGSIESLSLLAALFILKPVVTALSLQSGASGGLFTPLFSSGAVLGGLLGGIWNPIMSGGSIAAYAMLGAAAALAAGLQAPLSGLVLVLELTHSGLQIIVPLMIATLLATAVSRRLDGYSIYSARLPVNRSEEGTA